MPARAEVERSRVGIGGYLRVMTRPDLQGGNGRLGFWNLYGRLLNEAPWAALDLRLDLLQPEPGTRELWSTAHLRVEGGSVANADPLNGSLVAYRLSQLYVRAGNVLLDRVTWQLGTLESYFGDLALYDLRPAQLFSETLGVSARYERDGLDVLLGAGDSGYALREGEYDTVFTVGGSARVRLGGPLELGAGGQLMFEPSVAGNRFAPHTTPGVTYDAYVRREVLETLDEESPANTDLRLPNPDSDSSLSFKLIGYLGFGDLGPLRWSNLFANYLRLHPDNFYVERYERTGGQDFVDTVYVKELTDQRHQVNVGNEMQLVLVPETLDAVWAVLAGHYWDDDNAILPSDDEQSFYSTVIRLQYYVTETVHLLGETSLAYELSHNGNRWREHEDSLFRSEDGAPDSRGLEFGDADTRTTWQGKAGVVLNPVGIGIFVRPSLRLLYGVQYSTQNNAFGNSFVETLDQYSRFESVERHWHHVIAVEAEAWF